MAGVADSSAIDLDLPPPPDDIINTSYVTDPSDVRNDVYRPDLVQKDSNSSLPPPPPPPPPPEDDVNEPGPEARLNTSRIHDRSAGHLSFDESFTEADAVGESRLNSSKVHDRSRGHVSFDTSFTNPHNTSFAAPETDNRRTAETARTRYSPAENAAYDASENLADDRLTDNQTLNHSTTEELTSPVGVDDSLDSVLVEGDMKTEDSDVLGGLRGLDNEAYAYDGDAETDLSYSFQGSPSLDPPVMRAPNPFPVLDRPSSGHYRKNPALEKKKAPVSQGPFDPQVGVFLNPPLAIKPDTPTDGTKVRKRIPRPPSKWRFTCAYFWSCFACLVGNFLCAIPALRYAVTAKESSKIGDYNSANSYLRKTAILATVAIALAVGGWAVLILYLSGSL